MDIKKTLTDFREKIDGEIEEYLDEVIKEAKKKDIFIADTLRYVKKFLLAGGKRLRPAFMYYGYLAAGGKEKEKILKASVSVELIHAYLLIHDDIIDNDCRRHNIDTVNYRYQKIAKKIPGVHSPESFGNSMAIIIGDMVCALGNERIFRSGFEAKLVIEALKKLQGIVSLTVIGQSQDMNLGFKPKATEKNVLDMYENKTARYTIEGPLHLGAALSNASQVLLDSLSAYSIPVGIAFQIQDDILGIFGSEKKLGKPVGSDIEEGKKTLLVIKALENGTEKQRSRLKNILGKRQLRQEEIEEFRQIIIATGALQFAQEKAKKLIDQGRTAIENKKINPEAKEFMLGVADYMISREL
jgi:geranylgeranyl diphosphate synthase, type I